MIPTLTTRRLALRPYRIEDFPAYRAFVTSDRARFMGGPHPEATAWAWFCNDTASWALYGFGGLMIESEARPVGCVTVTQGPDFPEPEIGWLLFEGFEGKGYATEAARALRALLAPRLPSLVSYVDPDNARAIRLTERLAAVRDPEAATPGGLGCLVFRHKVGAAA